MGSVFENYAQEDYEEGGVHYEAVFTQLTTDQKLLIRVISQILYVELII